MILPSITLVTPSYNQSEFLEACIQSVLGQKYPALEYFVMDGDSSDGSKDIIRAHAQELSSWVSEKDNGQYHAIEKGFSRATGEIFGWLNSDDQHTAWTLSIVGEIFATFPEVKWLTTLFPLRWDAFDRAVSCRKLEGFSRRGFLQGHYLPGSKGFFGGMVQQESTFWRRELWEKCGGNFDTAFQHAGDFDLWMRFSSEAELYGICTPLAGFRMHGKQKTGRILSKYHIEADQAWRLRGGAYPGLAPALQYGLRDRLPSGLRSTASTLGLLNTARVIQRSRDNSRWEIASVLV